MYSSGYSQVSKYSPQARKKMQHRSKGKSCGYYMRIVFFFSSLIQSLIIVSLVLFLVYGKTQDSASTDRILDLEESFSRLSIENVELRLQRKNLTNLLNATLIEKARNDWDLAKLRRYCNISILIIQESERKLQQCKNELLTCNFRTFSNQCPTTMQGNCNCGLLGEQLKARFELVQSNFTQTVQRMRMDRDLISQEKDRLNLEVIRLRRDKFTLEKELELNRQQSKNEFSQSLRSVSNVSKAFLQKIESLFPSHIAFQISCPKQREHLEQIRTNCTSLSREVEDKLQVYLNIVGDQVSGIQSENSRLKAENWRLSDDYRWCSQNRTNLIEQHRQNLNKLQQKHDQDKERLLEEKVKLGGDIKVLESSLNYKSKVIDHLAEQVKMLNMSCMSKTGGFSGGLSSRSGTQSLPGWGSLGLGSSSVGQLGRTGSGSSFGSSGSAFNKPAASAAGSSPFSSLGSTSGLGSTGSAFNKPASTGGLLSSYGSAGSSTSLSSAGTGSNKPASTGGLFSSYGSAGSSTSLSSAGTGSNKPASTGGLFSSYGSTGSSTSLSSAGTGSNKPASTGGLFSSYGSTGSSTSLSSAGTGSNKPAQSGRGSLATGSSSGSTGSSPNLSSSGTGSNKPTSIGKSSSSFGSSSGSTGSTGSSGSTGSTGSTSKSGSSSSGFSWLGFGNNNSGQSKTGSVPGKGTSSGGTGTFGSGRTSGLTGGSVSISQHLQDLQRLINPPGPEEKQDLSRVLG